MWEREAVLDATRHLLDSARAGRGGTLLVVGEAGLGKTSVLEHARQLAGGEVRVGAGGCQASSSSITASMSSTSIAPLT